VGSGRNSVLWALVLTPFLCGIGTNTSIADYAGQGTVFFAAAGILLLGFAEPTAIFRVAAVALAGLCLIQASRVSSALLGMYRLGSVLDQTEKLKTGPEAGGLRVDRNTLQQVESIRRILEENRFRNAAPVVGVDSLCGWIYLSGGTSPGVPWFFRDQPKYLQQVLAKLDDETLRSSWIWLRSSSLVADPAGWWPSRRISLPREVAGRMSFSTDRGMETLSCYAPQP